MSAWVARDHAVSATLIGLNAGPFQAGEVYIADTDLGVIAVTLTAEQGTDDIELLREHFVLLTETFRQR